MTSLHSLLTLPQSGKRRILGRNTLNAANIIFCILHASSSVHLREIADTIHFYILTMILTVLVCLKNPFLLIRLNLVVHKALHALAARSFWLYNDCCLLCRSFYIDELLHIRTAFVVQMIAHHR